MAIQPYAEQSPYETDRPEIAGIERVTTSGPHPTKRQRWATTRFKKEEGLSKRRSVLRRFHKSSPSGQTATSDGADSEEGSPNKGGSESSEEGQSNGRTIFFNRALPASARDEDGSPKVQFARNKIRTAKYTPLSFIPKNLFFQFHNIANIYFLFIIILGIFQIFGADNPGLNAVPLIVIVTITAIKDAIEDTRRTVLDNELNNSPVHRLVEWSNVNTLEDKVSIWRRIKKASSHSIAAFWHLLQRKKKDKSAGKRYAERAMDQSRPSLDRNRMSEYTEGRPSFQSSRNEETAEGVELTPVPSPRASNEQPGARASWGKGPTGDGHLQVPGTPAEKDNKLGNSGPKQDVIAFKRDFGSLIDPARDATGTARFKKDAWKNVQVGDFVRLYNEEAVPADIVVLNTSDPDGACYVETKNLDGETNLKVRQSLRAGRKIKRAKECEKTDFWIESEGPHPNLYQYSGVARWNQRSSKDTSAPTKEMAEPISINNLLLRGCSIRNTEWVLGVVVFTGQESKIMLNSGITPSKRAKISRDLNWNVIYNFVILFFMCLVAALVNGVANAQTATSMQYFEYGGYGSTPSLNGFITFWAAVVLFQNLVPIALFISLEIVRTFQAFFIYSDIGMYYERLDYPCTPKSWNISDDLGQIEYVFSDKTGTLTQNIMEFKKATVAGVPYGEAYTEAMAGMQKRKGIDTEAEGARAREQIARDRIKMVAGLREIHDNPYLRDDELTFVAPDFVEDLRGHSGQAQQEANQQFMLVLALCHTVVTERTPGNPPKLEFKAQSPDEAALVATARDCGFTVIGRSSEGVIVNVQGEDVEYTVLNVLEFNSTRKRMSAIMRMPDGRIMLFCKGADSVIYSRLAKGEQYDLRKATAEHLEMFAREGLRTLCIAQRELSEEEYQLWNKDHEIAAAAVQDRDEKLEVVSDAIEQNLTLLGGTAIEDRLQEGVPDAIALLGNAGIKLWVLTGDKVETAINIGFSCNLLNNDMDMLIFKIEDDSLETAEQELDKFLTIFGMTGSDEELKAAKKNHEPPAPTHAVVIDGDSLKLVLSESLRQKFLLLCKQCKSVLCCRVSPAQKAAVVSMVKTGLDVMTLSIGDGANDVAMIQEADVGVGIAGEEGRQAVMSSDFAIGQFRFLARLMLVHGRWCYRRMGETIANFFYKNIIWTFALFWYSIYTNFDCSYIFDYTYVILYNLAFTSLTVLFLGILDQDVSDKVSLAVPQLYRRGIERKEWTQFKFWIYMFDGLYQSIISFFITYLLFRPANFNSEDGLNLNDNERMGVYLAHPIVIAANLYVLMNTYRWDWATVGITVFGTGLIWLWTGAYGNFTTSFQFYKSGPEVYGTLSFWATLLLTVILCLLPRFFIKSWQKIYYPRDIDIIREQVRQHKFDYLNDLSADALLIPRHPNYQNGSMTKTLSSSDNASTPPQVRQSPHGGGPRDGLQVNIPEEQRPIVYPPSTAQTSTTRNGPHSTQGSDETMRTFDHSRQSLDHRSRLSQVQTGLAAPHSSDVSPSLYTPPSGGFSPISALERPRPSFERARTSMDQLRPSFEQSDMTSLAGLMRVESSQSNRVAQGSKLR